MIDDVSVDGGTATVGFSSDPNARVKCKLNNQQYRRFRRCECVLHYVTVSNSTNTSITGKSINLIEGLRHTAVSHILPIQILDF